MDHYELRLECLKLACANSKEMIPGVIDGWNPPVKVVARAQAYYDFMLSEPEGAASGQSTAAE